MSVIISVWRLTVLTASSEPFCTKREYQPMAGRSSTTAVAELRRLTVYWLFWSHDVTVNVIQSRRFTSSYTEVTVRLAAAQPIRTARARTAARLADGESGRGRSGRAGERCHITTASHGAVAAETRFHGAGDS